MGAAAKRVRADKLDTIDRRTDAAKGRVPARGPATAASAKSGMVHIRLDGRLKEEAVETLDEIGISLPEAIRVFLSRVVRDRAFPFRLEAPNPTTRAAMEEGRRLGGRFATAQALFDDLETADE